MSRVVNPVGEMTIDISFSNRFTIHPYNSPVITKFHDICPLYGHIILVNHSTSYNIS